MHALVLHPQDVDDVGFVQPLDRRGRDGAERLDLAREQRRRGAHRHARAHPGEREDVRARNAGVHHVADDPDAGAVQ